MSEETTNETVDPTALTKAYDFQVLTERMKKAGLAHSEKAVAETYSIMKDWAKESAKLSANPWDDMTIPFYGQIDAVVLPQIDKISDEVETN